MLDPLAVLYTNISSRPICRLFTRRSERDFVYGHIDVRLVHPLVNESDLTGGVPSNELKARTKPTSRSVRCCIFVWNGLLVVK